MPGSALLALALATPAGLAAVDPTRISVGLPAEVDLVGLAVGVHPELLFRPFRPDGALHLRAATGLMVGPELMLFPVSLGVREELFARKAFNLGLGAGLQLQTFLPYDLPAHPRLDMYLELSATVRVADSWHVGVQLSPEIGMVGGFGLGMATRVGVQRDLPL